MSTSLDNIWDEPLLNSPPRTPVRQKTPSALFLDGPDEEHNNPNDVLREPMDIDKLFEGLDDDDGDSNTKTKDKTSSQPFDINAYRRKAQERAAKEVASDPVFSKYAVQSSSPPRDLGDENSGNKKDGKKDKDGDEPKQRKKVMRLDENRLLSKDGFPALIRQVKEFKPRGKGHEVWLANFKCIGIRYIYMTQGCRSEQIDEHIPVLGPFS
jgi:replication fork protection complex subunit Csm3/Swi3